MRAAGWLLDGGPPASPGPPWTAQEAESRPNAAVSASIPVKRMCHITLGLSMDEMPEFSARPQKLPLVTVHSDIYHALYVCAAGPRLMHPSETPSIRDPLS